MTPTATPTAPAPTTPGDVFSEVLPWLVMLLAVVLVGTIVISAIRKRIHSGGEESGQGFTLHDLRRMHAAGDLTDEQFQRAKAGLIEAVRPSTSENMPAPEAPETVVEDDSAD